MTDKSLRRTVFCFSVAALWTLAAAPAAWAQGTLADYQRAQGLQAKARGLVVNTPGAIEWIGHTDHFWYPRAVKGGTEFVLVDAAAGTKKPAFDHEKLAAAISTVTGHSYTGITLPFAPQAGRGGRGRGAAGATPMTAPLRFADDEQSIQFGTGGAMYKCSLGDYTCTKGGPIPANAGRGARGGAPAEEPAPEYLSEENGGDPVDGLEYQPFPQQGGGGGGAFGRGQPGCAPRPQASATPTGGRGGRGAATASATQEACRSFDGKWDAIIENFNVFLRPVGSSEPATPLSFDGSEGNYYTLRTVAWSPDSKKLAAYHTRPGYDRQVYYVQSSPYGPGPAQTFQHCDDAQFGHGRHVPEARRRARYRLPRALRHRQQAGDRNRSRAVSESLTTSLRRSGGRTAAASPSNTTSAATRCIA